MTAKDGWSIPKENGINIHSDAMVAGLWMMTEISIMSLRNNTQKSCGMSRKRVLSATWEPVYISKI